MAKRSKLGAGKLILIGLAVLIGTVLISPSGLLHQVHRLGETIEGLHALAKMSEADTVKADSAQQNNSSIVARSTAAVAQTAQVGMNVSGVVDYSTQWPFVDMFKSAGPWISQRQGADWGKGGPLALTPDGWVASLQPGQYAEIPLTLNGGRYPAGQYTLLYDGQGTIEFGLDGVEIVSRSPGRMLLKVTPKEHGIFLKIVETNSSNPLRNIRFIMPGFENTYEKQPFHPLFLERLSKFSVLRFMDWQQTNGSPVKEWSDRTLPTAARQVSDNGVALEYMIQLANTAKANPWFTIPHQASDDYVRKFAAMVRDRLDPSLKVYIEYSNEVWNSMFEQTNYVLEKGVALNLSDDRYQAGLRYYSQRAVEVFKLWEDEFKGTDRLVRVLASQAANPWTAEQVLSWKEAYRSTDAYAIAPYFYGGEINDRDKVDSTLKLSPDQIIDQILTEVRTSLKRNVAENAAVTQKYKVALVAYEGGSHLTSQQMPEDKEAKVTDLFIAANRHPRMREVYKEYLTQWKQAGGGLFMQYSSVYAPNKYGSWGALEYQNQDLKTAPKYLGLLDYLEANGSKR